MPSAPTLTAAPAPLVQRLCRPELVFLYICVVYLCFPSREFGVDALHYNMRALLTAGGAAGLLGDISVPVHLAWHAAAAGVLWLTGTHQPLSALFILTYFDIVVALASLFLFLRLCRAVAGDFAAVSATLILAFSHACLRFFLSVEVYALNNLALIALIAFVHRSSVRGATWGTRQLVLLGLLSMAAITTHLSNLLLVPVLVLYFVALDSRRATVRSAIYLAVLGALLSLSVLWVCASTSLGLREALDYLLGYSAKSERYMAGSALSNAIAFLRSLPTAALGSLGALLYVPLALLAYAALRHGRTLWADGFFKFLVIHLAFAVGFYSQWDASNIEHKIAILPVLLLLALHVHARLGPRWSFASRAAVLALVALFAVVGVTQGIAPYRQLDQQELYRLAAAIHDVTGEREVVVTGLASGSSGHPVVMASMTFFGQRVHLLDATDPRVERTLQGFRERGVVALVHDDGRFAPLGVALR